MRGRTRGFTLIEILVAVVIIGIVMSVAILSIGVVGDDREVRTEARRLIALLEVAQDDAMLQGREFGIEFLVGGYRFVEYDPVVNEWTEPFGDDSLRFWPLPEEVEFSLYLEDRLVDLDADPASLEQASDNERQASEQYAPHLLIYSSGDMTPFELLLTRRYDQQVAGLRGDFLGNLEMIDNDELERY